MVARFGQSGTIGPTFTSRKHRPSASLICGTAIRYTAARPPPPKLTQKPVFQGLALTMPPPSGRQPQARNFLALKATILCAPALLAGCADNMDAIDRRLERVLGERAAELDAGSLTPSPRVAKQPIDRPTKDQTAAFLNTDPSSTNPAAGDLQFVPADEARDVAARLDRYSRIAAGADSAALPEKYDIAKVFQTSQRTGREFLSAEEEYLLSAINLLTQRHLWGPRLFNDTTFAVAGQGDDGDFQHAASVINNLRATQRLPSGGQVEAGWIWNATEQLRTQATGRYRQSSSLVASAEIPLLRGAGSVAREDLIQAERNLIYSARTFERFRRIYLVDIATDYFALLELRSQIANQERQLEGLVNLRDSTAARVASGRLSEFQTAIAANRVLGARADLAGLRERSILAEDRFKIRLGLDPSQSIEILPLEFEVPEPEITPEEAVLRAMEYRLDLQNSRDRLNDSRRRVANARNQLLPDLNIGGRVAVPTPGSAREGGLNFDPDQTDYRAEANLSLPLDREIERLSVRSAQVDLQRATRDLDQLRDTVAVSVRTAVRNIDLARFQLELANRQVEINKARLEEQELKQDSVDPQSIVDTRNDLLDAENQRDRARTNLRTAVLQYLLDSDQLRVARDGTFQRLGPSQADAPSVPETPAAAPEVAAPAGVREVPPTQVAPIN